MPSYTAPVADTRYVLEEVLGIDPEAALREATQRFEDRFRRVETLTEAPLHALSIDQLEALWQQAKRELAVEV